MEIVKTPADRDGPADHALALRFESGSGQIGVGSYPQPSLRKRAGRLVTNWALMRHVPGSDFMQKVLGTNTSSMDVLRTILFKTVPTVRINDAFVEPEMATDLLEHDLNKLNRLVQKGRLSFAAFETRLQEFLIQ